MGDHWVEKRTGDRPFYAIDSVQELAGHIRRPCEACGSQNTVCIFDETIGSIIGYHMEEEYRCGDCGKYTAWTFDYES